MPVYERPKGSGRWYADIPAPQSGTGRRERYRISEASNKKQEKCAEAKIRTELFEARYLGRRRTPLFETFFRETYMPWAEQNKRSAAHDRWRGEKLMKFFRGKTLAEISPLMIEK